MLIGKKCKIGSKMNRNIEGCTFYDGVIVCEPQLGNVDGENNYFYVLVAVGGELKTVDADYIYDVSE